MLLRSVMRHVREQNWTAFGIEFLIVVIGVLRRQVVFVQGDHEVRPGLA